MPAKDSLANASVASVLILDGKLLHASGVFHVFEPEAANYLPELVAEQ